MIDDSSYMGVSLPSQTEVIDEVEPNKEVLENEQIVREQLQLAYGNLKKILTSEKDNVLKITDLPDLNSIEMDIEVKARIRYVNMIDVLLGKLEVKNG